MSDKAWIVHKFGGTSVANSERYRAAADILQDAGSERQGVVVSAMAGVTNALIDLIERAVAQDAGYRDAIDRLREQHVAVIDELLSDDPARALKEALTRDFEDVGKILGALWLLRSEADNARALISGMGEVWSARLLAAHLAERGRAAAWLDAREVLVVGAGELAPYVDWQRSQERLDRWLADRPDLDIAIITGYVAADENGVPTTLGRNGSDYSAAIFGALLAAQAIHIWTDVDGVMSADPRQVPDAVVLPALSYDEAMELAYFGAKVIHPSTMAPAVPRAIPIFIRNTFRPELPGTKVHTRATPPPSETQRGQPAAPDLSVKGIATVDGMALLNVEGSSMIGVPGIAHRLFGALREAQVSVVLISQGSSEHSICFAVPAEQAETAKKAVETAFFAERHHGQIQTVEVAVGCTILAVVGDNMAGIPGVASRFFGALGASGVNVRAIAQGASERNISAVIDTDDSFRALRAVHASFYLSPQTISVGVVGTGVVGSTFIDQLETQIPRLRQQYGIDLRVRALATSDTMWLSESPLELSDWRTANASRPLDLEAFVDWVHTDALPHAVLIDATASDDMASHYPTWLRRGIHVITPNKRAGSGPMARYQDIKAACRERGMRYHYETTVGAGLPIIHTLRDLEQTGDKVLSISGILSGTLAYLFTTFDGQRPFSELVREARDKGYSEPDPRDDLSGMDVARKLVIMGREIGLQLELSQVIVQSLVPPALASVPLEEFLERLPELDHAMRVRFAQAKERGDVLRYMGTIDTSGVAAVMLMRLPSHHPFAGVRSTENIVAFRTNRYNKHPLLVQGPGAGPEVTAGGVFADLLRLADFLGANR